MENQEDPASRAMGTLVGLNSDELVDTIVRMAASTVLGSSCTREQLFSKIDAYLQGTFN